MLTKFLPFRKIRIRVNVILTLLQETWKVDDPVQIYCHSIFPRGGNYFTDKYSPVLFRNYSFSVFGGMVSNLVKKTKQNASTELPISHAAWAHEPKENYYQGAISGINGHDISILQY